MTLRLPQVYSILRQQCVKILDADATCAFIPSESTPFASLTQGLEWIWIIEAIFLLLLSAF